MRSIVPALTGIVGAVALTLLSPPASSTPGHFAPPARTADAVAAVAPSLQVTTLANGLNLPWDAQPIPHGRLLITERESKRLLMWQPNGPLRRVAFPASTVWAGSETGLMSLEVDPAFERNHRFYTCQGSPTAGGGKDIRVMAWKLETGPLRATLQRRLLTGMPVSSGRHGGCRLLIGRSGAMMVGTGDAAVGTNPQDLNSLGGKTLRLHRFSGAPWPSNPDVDATSSKARRYLMTHGHRNVQGLAQRSDGTVWSAEHGPDRDDEVNRISLGGDYGWDPRPGYDETVPMTDHDLQGTQLDAAWSSGVPTVATSGIAWVHGDQWQDYNGALAVANLKGSRLIFMTFDADGDFVRMSAPEVTAHGRLRSVTSLDNGDLVVTTSNDNGNDKVLRVRP